MKWPGLAKCTVYFICFVGVCWISHYYPFSRSLEIKDTDRSFALNKCFAHLSFVPKFYLKKEKKKRWNLSPQVMFLDLLFLVTLFFISTVDTNVLTPPLSTSAVIDSNSVSGVRTRKSSTGSLDTLTSIAITAAVTTTSSVKYANTFMIRDLEILGRERLRGRDFTESFVVHFKKIDVPESFIRLLFTRKVSTFIFIEGGHAFSPRWEMVNLLAFDNLFPLLKREVGWRRLPPFPAKMTVVHALHCL